MNILTYTGLVLDLLLLFFFFNEANVNKRRANQYYDDYKMVVKNKESLEEENYKLKDRLNKTLVILGEFPIKTFDLKAKYYHSTDKGLHNRSIIQLPNTKFQIVCLDKDGSVSSSSDMGVVDTEQKVLDYMNKTGYVKLRDIQE